MNGVRRAGGLLLALLALGADAAMDGIFIREAQLLRRGDMTLLNADVDYRLGQAATAALEHGIPLTLRVEFSLRRARRYWPDQTVLEERRRIQLRYHPLAKSFQIADLDSGAVQAFPTLAAMLNTLGRLRGWPIHGAERLDPDADYVARLRLVLDIEALPLPLRAEAYVAPAWRLATPPLEWRLEP